MTDALLPPAAVLLHVGPAKTGTTTTQQALWDARRRMARAGVLFPAGRRHPRAAVLAATGVAGVRGEPPADPGEWTDIVRRIEAAPDRRVVLSSEIFAATRRRHIPAVVESLGGARVHVAITLRPLERILSSHWQQQLQNRFTIGFPAWLDEVFNSPDGPHARAFWRRHDIRALTRRWDETVGADHVCVVAGDENDPHAVLDGFEALLGLPRRTLRARGAANRSLTLAEAELVRWVNLAARREQWSDQRYARVVRNQLCYRLTQREPHPDEPRIAVPQWARAAAVERQTDDLDALRALGVRLVGDPGRMRATAGTGASTPAAAEEAGAHPDNSAAAAAVALLDRLARRDSILAALSMQDVSGLRRRLRARMTRAHD